MRGRFAQDGRRSQCLEKIGAEKGLLESLLGAEAGYEIIRVHAKRGEGRSQIGARVKRVGIDGEGHALREPGASRMR